MTQKLSRAERDTQYKRYYISYNWKSCTSTRVRAVVPILFKTRDSASQYLQQTGFKNMQGRRKCSACIKVRWLK